MGIQVDSERELLRQVDLSLKEWGRWSTAGGGTGLGYPSRNILAKVGGREVESYDMGRVEEVENAYTFWKMYTLKYTAGMVRRHRQMLLFILRIHYTEAGLAADKAHNTGRAFHRRMSRSQYYLLLREARLKLATLLC